MNRFVYLLAPMLAWVAAQLMKMTLRWATHKRIVLGDLIASGNMPSAHMAGTTALLTVLGDKQGLDSPIFALCFILAVLIAYDSAGVRRTAGESARSIKAITSKLDMRSSQPKHISSGHTPAEVAGGAVLGLFIGYILTILL